MGKVDIFNTNNKYNVIYADPPWEYKQKGGINGKRGMAEAHYPTMDTDSICNLPIRDISTDSTVLFMWATFPNIDQAFEVIYSWGFIYKTAAFVWVKRNKQSDTYFWGMGAYTRANAEVCLLAVSKNTKASKIIKRHDIHQIVYAPVEHHSKKPDIVRDNIVSLLGRSNTKYIELFAREEISGWDCWGNGV